MRLRGGMVEQSYFLVRIRSVIVGCRSAHMLEA